MIRLGAFGMSTLCPSVSVTVCVLVDEVVELVGVAVSLSEEGEQALNTPANSNMLDNVNTFVFKFISFLLT